MKAEAIFRNLEAAAAAVANGTGNNEAARAAGVSKSTLSDFIARGASPRKPPRAPRVPYPVLIFFSDLSLLLQFPIPFSSESHPPPFFPDRARCH